jgi:hypothetical protein
VTRFPIPVAGLCAAALAFGGAANADPRFAHGPGTYGPPQGARFEPAGGYAGRPAGRREPPPEAYGERPRYAPYAPPPPREDFPRGASPRGDFAPRGEPPGGGWRAGPQPPPRSMPYPGRMASLGWVIERIQHRSPGRQLDAEIDYLGGRPVYRVLWVTAQGRRVDYLVDAATGVILSGR